MASFDELSFQYSLRLKKARNPEQEFIKILSEIKKLVHVSDNLHLSNEEKAIIVDKIIANLQKPSEIGDPFENIEYLEKFVFEHKEVVKCFSNDNYLELIKYIKSQTKK